MVRVSQTTVEPPQRPLDVLDDPSAGAKAIRGSAVRTAGYVVGSLLTLVSVPLLVRHLGIVEAGHYFTVISLIGLVGGVTDLGLATVAVREYSVRHGAARDAFMREILGARMALTLAGVLAATAFAAVAGYGGELVAGTAVAGAGLMLTVVGHTYSVALSAELRVGWLTVIDLLLKAVSVALVVALVLLAAGVVAFLAVPVPVGIAALATTVMLVRGRIPLRPSFATAELRRLLRDTLPMAVATVLSTFYARITIIVMSLFAGELATGYFGTASRIVEVAVGIPLSLIGTTFPIFARAARDDPERFRYVLQRVAEVALIGGVWMTLGTALAARPISDALVASGAEAEAVADVLRILALALALIFLNVTWQTALVALRRYSELLVINAIALVVIVVLVVALVSAHDARGAAMAVVGGETCLTILATVALRRARPDLRLELRVVPRVTIAAGTALAIALALPVPPAVAAGVVTLVYFGGLMALRAIPHEATAALRERLPGR